MPTPSPRGPPAFPTPGLSASHLQLACLPGPGVGGGRPGQQLLAWRGWGLPKFQGQVRPSPPRTLHNCPWKAQDPECHPVRHPGIKPPTCPREGTSGAVGAVEAVGRASLRGPACGPRKPLTLNCRHCQGRGPSGSRSQVGWAPWETLGAKDTVWQGAGGDAGGGGLGKPQRLRTRF